RPPNPLQTHPAAHSSVPTAAEMPVARLFEHFIAGRLLAWRGVQCVAKPADLEIGHLTDAIDHPQWFMCRQRVPGTEREIFAKARLLRTHDVLGRDDDLADMLGRSDVLGPFD